MTVARDLAALRDDAAECTRCHLYRDATQTVFGQGPADADLMLVGEQQAPAGVLSALTS